MTETHNSLIHKVLLDLKISKLNLRFVRRQTTKWWQDKIVCKSNVKLEKTRRRRIQFESFKDFLFPRAFPAHAGKIRYPPPRNGPVKSSTQNQEPNSKYKIPKTSSTGSPEKRMQKIISAPRSLVCNVSMRILGNLRHKGEWHSLQEAWKLG